MLGWVIICHDDKAQDMLHCLRKKYDPLEQYQAVSFWRGLSSNMLSRMMCHTLRVTDSGEGVIFLAGMAGAVPYRVASLMSHKHLQCEVTSDISYPLLERMVSSRESLSSSTFRNCIVALGNPEVTGLWYQRQKNPPFVLKRDLYKY